MKATTMLYWYTLTLSITLILFFYSWDVLQKGDMTAALLAFSFTGVFCITSAGIILHYIFKADPSLQKK